MKASCLRVIALALCCLFTVSFSSFAQINNSTAAAYPNSAAIASYSDATVLSLRDITFSLGRIPENPQEQAKSVSADVRTLSLQDLAFSLGQSGAPAKQQTKPASGNAPSLQDLGFSPAVTRGSAKMQALLNKRSHMLQIHQKLGLLTTIPLVATVFTGPGAKGHHGLPGSATGRDVHEGLGALTADMYFTSAYFAVRAPKVPGIKTRGNVRLHKAMAWIHGPGMILTPVLGAIAFSQVSRGERVHGIAKYHSIVAYTTVGAYGVAILSVSLNKF
jgi:hypothetical protein